MTNDTKLSDLTVGEFKALMRECLQQDMDAEKEVERLRAEFRFRRYAAALDAVSNTPE